MVWVQALTGETDQEEERQTKRAQAQVPASENQGEERKVMWQGLWRVSHIQYGHEVWLIVFFVKVYNPWFLKALGHDI